MTLIHWMKHLAKRHFFSTVEWSLMIWKQCLKICRKIWEKISSKNLLSNTLLKSICSTACILPSIFIIKWEGKQKYNKNGNVNENEWNLRTNSNETDLYSVSKCQSVPEGIAKDGIFEIWKRYYLINKYNFMTYFQLAEA